MSALDPFGKQRFCRGCGCTERNACTMFTPDGPVGCAWVLLDLQTPSGVCSACAIRMDWSQDGLQLVGFDVSGDDDRLTMAELTMGAPDATEDFHAAHTRTLVLP